MSEKSISILKWQFELTCELAQYHLPNISDNMCLWKPTDYCWSVHKDKNGKWIPDFELPEPNPLPSVSIAWLTWHIQRWWSDIIAIVNGHPRIDYNAVSWPGNEDGVREQFLNFQNEWTMLLNAQDEYTLQRNIIHQRTEPTPLWQSIAWVNAELMKNVSEIGQLSILYQNEIKES